MPSHACANPEIKQLYINGHFCYVFKFGIVTNGLGIIRHISFYNKDFMASHLDIVEKKLDPPDEDKCVHDSKLLIPALKDFFSRHLLINPKTFPGDAAFDTASLYKTLLSGDTFAADHTINEDGIPCCPKKRLHPPFLPASLFHFYFDFLCHTVVGNDIDRTSSFPLCGNLAFFAYRRHFFIFGVIPQCLHMLQNFLLFVPQDSFRPDLELIFRP